MQGAGAGGGATGAEGEGVGDLALSGSEIARAVPMVSLAAQPGDTPAAAVSINVSGPAGTHHVDAAGQRAQLAAHAQPGPLGGLAHSHNQQQIMQMLAHQHMQMLSQMPAAASLAQIAVLRQHAAAFAGAQPGACSTGAQQGAPGAGAPGAQAVSQASCGGHPAAVGSQSQAQAPLSVALQAGGAAAGTAAGQGSGKRGSDAVPAAQGRQAKRKGKAKMAPRVTEQGGWCGHG
eukprot:Tamp_17454.p2 GENE.Tamp_17454~~Tamp_17454.p2  ORF type:complete len:233 (+),score=28.05 Tamp_17454:116-814(+)